MNTQEKLKLVRQLLEGLVETPNVKAQQALEVLDCTLIRPPLNLLPLMPLWLGAPSFNESLHLE